MPTAWYVTFVVSLTEMGGSWEWATLKSETSRGDQVIRPTHGGDQQNYDFKITGNFQS